MGAIKSYRDLDVWKLSDVDAVIAKTDEIGRMLTSLARRLRQRVKLTTGGREGPEVA
jgi:hypothetical protein